MRVALFGESMQVLGRQTQVSVWQAKHCSPVIFLDGHFVVVIARNLPF